MAGTYRLRLQRLDDSWVPSHADVRWALTALDPANSNLLCGAFQASDGADVPYRLWNAKDEPRALILLLHGATDYSGAYDEIGPLLASRGFIALAYDQRGFGATASRGHWVGKHRMMDDVKDAAAFLRKRTGTKLPLFIIGESMGAAIAVRAAPYVADIAGLVLAAPGAVAGGMRRMAASFALRALNTIAPHHGLVLERLTGWELAPASAIRLLSDPMVLRGMSGQMLFGLLRLSISAIDKARRVKVPALTMVGTEDDLLRTACIKQLHKSLKGRKAWAIFEDGPHLLLHWEHRARVIERVVSWIDARLLADRI
ncbi:MAG TPA: alpha/beta fold hydrolase [Rhizomicrobium sp.]|jgi:alpha-beta hydrolase superfamily lysophospholipase